MKPLTIPEIRITLAEPIARVPDEGAVVAFDAGPGATLFVALALRPLDFSETHASGAAFPKTRPEVAQRYRVVGTAGGESIDVVTGEEPFNIHFVQPLGEELLLVCGRSVYRGAGDIERNGRVYGRDGQFRRELLLGDGIQSVQTTADGVIWTSYFDEGIFGNLGWSTPLGESGLVAWDSAGESLYHFTAPGGLERVADCYALNVASDSEAWCYYYTDFPLVRISNYAITGSWSTPVAGATAFAVSGRHVLFYGSYKDPDGYLLCVKREAGKGRERAAGFRRQLAAEEALIPDRVSSPERTGAVPAERTCAGSGTVTRRMARADGWHPSLSPARGCPPLPVSYRVASSETSTNGPPPPACT